MHASEIKLKKQFQKCAKAVEAVRQGKKLPAKLTKDEKASIAIRAITITVNDGIEITGRKEDKDYQDIFARVFTYADKVLGPMEVTSLIYTITRGMKFSFTFMPTDNDLFTAFVRKYRQYLRMSVII